MPSTTKTVLLCAAAGLVGALSAWNYAKVSGGQSTSVAPAADLPMDATPTLVAAPAMKAHNYDVHDGTEYGYTSAVSQAQREAGQVGANIIMFRYAGERDGVHQLHMIKGSVYQALECRAPCEVVKIMTVMDLDGSRRDVHVERVRNQPGMLAGMALDDAFHGRLEAYVETYDEKRFEVWVDERKGLVRTLTKAKSSQL